MNMDAKFNVFTDYNQFTVSDPTANFEDLYEKWNDETVKSMFIQGDRYIAVGTMRDFFRSRHLRARLAEQGRLGIQCSPVILAPGATAFLSDPLKMGSLPTCTRGRSVSRFPRNGNLRLR